MQEIIDDHYQALTKEEKVAGKSEPSTVKNPSTNSILPKRPQTGRIPLHGGNTQGTFTSFPPGRPVEDDLPRGRPTPPSDQSYRALAERAAAEAGTPWADEMQINESDLIELDAFPEVGDRAGGWVEKAERESSKELFRMAERLDGVDPRLVRAAHALETDKRSKEARAVSHGSAESLADINPKFLRAAGKAEKKASTDGWGVGKGDYDALFAGDMEPEVHEEDEDDWRERLEQSNSTEIISFLPEPVAEDPDDIL